MKRKLLATLLVMVMSVVWMTGCGGSTNEETASSSSVTSETGTTTEETSSSEAAEPDHIIMTYLTIGTTPADIQKVEDAVNAISVPEINVEVEFKPISIPETFSQYSLWVSTGEQVDLMMVAFQGVATYANTGTLEPLNELIEENAPYITSTMAEMPLTDGAVIDGEIYGVAPVELNYGHQGSLLFNQDMLDEAGIEVKDMYTLDEFTEIFVAVKEMNPDVYPYGIIGSDMTTGSMFGFYNVVDSLGASNASGVLLGADSTEIVNMFDTQEYYDYLKLVRSWYEAGYIMADAATTGSLKTELITNEIVSSYAMYNTPEQTSDSIAQYGHQLVALPTTEMFFGSISPSSNTYWTIPITSENPAAAMKFLDLTYSNHEVSNLIKSGIEGEHYVKTDVDGVIAYPEGIHPGNTTYFQPLGLYGDRRYELTFSEGSSRAVNEAFTNEAMANPTKGAGYSYDSSNMTTQMIAIQGVLDQYLPTIETGSVDVDSVYPDFIEALKNAGIDDVIADNQAQFDVWFAQQ